MKKFTKATVLALSVAIIISTLSGCTATDNTVKTEQSNSANQTSDDIDPFGIYEEAVTISVARRDFGDPIPTGEEAPWTKKYKEYGINVEVEWSSDASQMMSKLNTAIASGDVPDLFQVVGAEQINTLVRADMLADLTEAFEKYASPLVKERFMTEAGKAALESATYDGKLLFIPCNITESLNNMEPLYIRKDWLDNLGLEIPKTVEDFKNIAIAFTKNDPDQNGKNDTYGLALQGKNSFGEINSYFTGFGVYPGVWGDGMLFYSQDESGNATWDGEKAATKDALLLLQDLYKEGAIAQDFAVYDSTRAFEDLNGGKVGLTIGARGYPAWAIQNTYLNNKDAEWYAMKMPGRNGEEAMLVGYQPLNTGFAVSKDCKNPEAVIKMLNIVTEISEPRSAMYDADYLSANRTKTGDSIIYAIDNPENEKITSQEIFKAVKDKDPLQLPENSKKVYDNILKFEENGDQTAWSDWNRYYPESGHVYYVIYEMNKDTEIKDNLWQQLPSGTMTPKLAIWKKLFDEAFVKVVSGSDISEWDKAVADWNKLGGEQITKEVKDSLK